MKPQLRDDIAIYKPAAPITETNGKRIASVFKGNAATLKSLNLKAILLSFDGVEVVDEYGMKLILSAFTELENGLEVSTGIIDYSPDQYAMLKKMIGSRSVSLFKNFEVAFLMLQRSKTHRFDKVVLFDEDQMLRELVVGELSTKGYKVEVVDSRAEFDKLSRKKEPNTLYMADTHMDLVSSFIPTKVIHGSVVYQLQERFDKSFQTHFGYGAHQGRIKDGFLLFVFDASEVKVVNPRAYEFLISLSLHAVKFGGKIVLANLEEKLLPKPLKEKIEKAGIGLAETVDEVWKSPVFKKLQKAPDKSKGLTKKLVGTLPVFIDAALETFESLTGAKAVKKSHQISACSIHMGDQVVASSLGFEGEVNGALVLVFNESIARKAAEMLLGDDQCSFEELLDAISEFANIIGGRAKALMAEKDLHITIALPQTFDSTDKLNAFVGDKKGVQIELEMDGEPVVLFLTY